jgi:hypothetical protein
MNEFEDLYVVTTKANRVRQKCVFLDAEAENKWRYQYVMYLLDGKNKVIEVLQSTHLDKGSCYSQINEIEGLLQKDLSVRVCIRNHLEKMDSADEQRDLVSFDSLGNHQVAYKPLTLDSICNSKKCVGDNSAWVKTCPGFVKH